MDTPVLANRSAKTYIPQRRADTECCPSDLQRMIADRNEWCVCACVCVYVCKRGIERGERERDIIICTLATPWGWACIIFLGKSLILFNLIVSSSIITQFFFLLVDKVIHSMLSLRNRFIQFWHMNRKYLSESNSLKSLLEITADQLRLDGDAYRKNVIASQRLLSIVLYCRMKHLKKIQWKTQQDCI